MTNSEIKSAAEYLAEELRKLPDGTEISTAKLLQDCGYDLKQFGFNDLMDLHQELFCAAESRGITLDMSKHEQLLEGLPFYLEFVVRNAEA